MYKSITVIVLLLLTSCSTIRYDLEGVAFPVTANASTDGAGEEFLLASKHVMYVHGLLGEKQPHRSIDKVLRRSSDRGARRSLPRSTSKSTHRSPRPCPVLLSQSAPRSAMGKGGLTGVFWNSSKLRKFYEFRDFWDPAEICRKLPENYKTAQQLRENYAKNTISGNFQTFSVIFG